MDYYHIKTVLSSGKQFFNLRNQSDSFAIAGPSTRKYIEPTFEKVIYDTERPTIILISAVGATGKTAFAQQLSGEARLPILDLGKHKPVGDNTLTGILTSAYDVKDISGIFQGLGNGSYGVIIDALDEGRSKTTGKAFEAFLDDIVKLCRSSATTTFVILGRTQILEDSWAYLSGGGVSTGLITISPFDINRAKKYIDTFTNGITSPYKAQYIQARDFIIDKLGRAFAGHAANKEEEFLSFIGYPPVLDAIVTLLTEEQNFHRLLQELTDDNAKDVEVELLKRIAEYILNRERSEKVIPNIVRPIVDGTPVEISRPSLSDAFLIEEQSARLVAYCLRYPLTLPVIPEPTLNEKYEAQLLTWLSEHPFIRGHEFRNAVFEALALATIMTSQKCSLHEMATDYIASHKHSYHLVYMLDIISKDHRLAITHLNAILSSAMEFRSVHGLVELHVNGPYPEEEPHREGVAGEVEIDIEILLGKDHELAKSFSFSAEITHECRMQLGPRLGGAFVKVPCDITISGGQEVEITAPVQLSARCVQFNCKTLIVRPTIIEGCQQEVIVEAQRMDSNVESVSTDGVSFFLAIGDMTGVSYPIIQYAHKLSQPPTELQLRQKYFRLKRILLEFRSHSRGSLARYRKKIEQERVLRNKVGVAVLEKLLTDRVLSLRGEFYHLDPAGLDRIGVTWQDLRSGQISESLTKYLRSITV